MKKRQTTRDIVLAQFLICLNLPEGEQSYFKDAAAAVRKEYRKSVRWKRLRCRKVQPLTKQKGETIFIVEVGHSIEFDWTWEGAVAFRANCPDEFNGNIETIDDYADWRFINGVVDNRHGAWAGEIVEVDETNGRLFVAVNSPEHPPCIGTFFVRPFEFLYYLHSLYCQSNEAKLTNLITERLAASIGGCHPKYSGQCTSGLRELEHLWQHSWALLWGPPGTGKTHTLGRQVAACLGDWSERILVVSTTNRATDAAAFAIGRNALVASESSINDGKILRVGKGANWDDYCAQHLEGLLRGTETEFLQRITLLNRDLEKARQHEERACLRNQIQELRRTMKDTAFNIFVSPDVQIVICTAFKAMSLLNDPSVRSLVANGKSPFTTVVIDEAGLMSRAVVSALSLLASRRVVVVGDPKQLAPISKVSRVLPTSQKNWLASSCLSHLTSIDQVTAGVHLLREQHRMHPQVSQAVSDFQYDGVLQNALRVVNRQSPVPFLLEDQPRAIWYVLDEDHCDLTTIRAERGPGNKSWVRPCTRDVLAKLFSHTGIYQSEGLFITPFKAQARTVANYLAEENLKDWSAGTVHARQGTEADVVIFDTVYAGSTGWGNDEWKRLVNVGLSRAREFVFVLASRAEMYQPYLRPLLETLAPRILKRVGRHMVWTTVPISATFEVSPQIVDDPCRLGNQIAGRKSMRPVKSKEQEQLCGREMDGKPRLVRGVAGSGKTFVMGHWLQKTVQIMAHIPDAKVWAVYANQTLKHLIADTIEDAWNADQPMQTFPWDRVQLCHIQDILMELLDEIGMTVFSKEFENRYDYDTMAAKYLQAKQIEFIEPRCQAMFIDEAQDMGPNTLKLLTRLAEQTDAEDPNSRAVNIFYDNAQNIHGRGTPKWKDIGLGIHGRRSTIMKESFRSTKPITEFALNVLHCLQPLDSDPDHKELIDQRLIELTERNGNKWWNVRFNQVDGPMPIFKKYPNLTQQVDALSEQVLRWIREEGVKPGDISILCNDNYFKQRIQGTLCPNLREIGARIIIDPAEGWNQDERAVIVSTTASFKGYESEITVIAGVERFIGKGQILANTLYVAMTRARSILAIYAYAHRSPKPQAETIFSTVEKCLNCMLSQTKVEKNTSNFDDFEDVLQRLGDGKPTSEQQVWLKRLWESYPIQQEPIIANDGEILAEPLFWFKSENRTVACFGKESPGAYILHRLDDNGIEIIQPCQKTLDHKAMASAAFN